MDKEKIKELLGTITLEDIRKEASEILIGGKSYYIKPLPIGIVLDLIKNIGAMVDSIFDYWDAYTRYRDAKDGQADTIPQCPELTFIDIIKENIGDILAQHDGIDLSSDQIVGTITISEAIYAAKVVYELNFLDLGVGFDIFKQIRGTPQISSPKITNLDIPKED